MDEGTGGGWDEGIGMYDEVGGGVCVQPALHEVTVRVEVVRVVRVVWP